MWRILFIDKLYYILNISNHHRWKSEPHEPMRYISIVSYVARLYTVVRKTYVATVY